MACNKKCRTTSPRVAKIAAKQLRDKRVSKGQKQIAGSALSQATRCN